MRRKMVQGEDGFFSMKENPTGASVGNFMSNMKKLGQVPAQIKKAVTTPMPRRRMRMRKTY